MSKSVLILSGGLDSTTLLYELLNKNKEVHAISFAYGQKHAKELEMATATCRKFSIDHKVIALTSIGSILNSNALTGGIEIPKGHYQDESMKLTVVPNRNMIMLSIAIAYAINIGSEEVCYGAHAGDHDIYPDCRPEFVEAIQNVADVCHYNPIRVCTPYLYLTKAEIVERGVSLNVDYSLTWTCYEGRIQACGKCGSCTERLEAFDLNNVTDPIEYEV